MVLMQDTISANGANFSNYYLFRPDGHEDQLGPNSIVETYLTKQDGIIAFKHLSGKWWTKVKKRKPS